MAQGGNAGAPQAELPTLVVVDDLLSIVSRDGLWEVTLAGCGSYSLFRVNAYRQAKLAYAVHVLCRNSTMSSVTDMLTRYLSVPEEVAREMVMDSIRLNVPAAFESAEGAWAFLENCPDIMAAMNQSYWSEDEDGPTFHVPGCNMRWFTPKEACDLIDLYDYWFFAGK